MQRRRHKHRFMYKVSSNSLYVHEKLRLGSRKKAKTGHSECHSLFLSHNGREGDPSSPASSVNNVDIVRCTDHMCPVRVHWHVKNNYVDHWRVKLTVSNYNYKKNYSDWNVLVQHPSFNNLVKTYSLNATLLPAVGLGGTLNHFKD